MQGKKRSKNCFFFTVAMQIMGREKKIKTNNEYIGYVLEDPDESSVFGCVPVKKHSSGMIRRIY